MIPSSIVNVMHHPIMITLATILLASNIRVASSFTPTSTSSIASTTTTTTTASFVHQYRRTSQSPLNTLFSLSKNPSNHKSNPYYFKHKHNYNNGNFNSNSNSNFPLYAENNTNENKASVSLSSSITTPTSQQLNTPTAILDYILSIFTSDIGSIIIGSIGLLLALYNRLSSIDFDSTSIVSSTYAESINIQSRNDLLAVFASGAVLLNGISKLDITSVLAESVLLNGKQLDQPIFVNCGNKVDENGASDNDANTSKEIDLKWAMNAILSSTPAKTAVLLTTDPTTTTTNNTNTNTNDQSLSKWMPILLAGIIPSTSSTSSTIEEQFIIPKNQATPILDRFLKQTNAKESYLPTLQALPGKVEFTYLPDNAQEALLLPIKIKSEGQGQNKMLALVVGSDTAKSFTPRDVAWCQVLATRIGDQMV
jgi:hypothetical protein